MFKVTYDILAQRNDMLNTFINFYIERKMNCALMFIKCNHYVRKCLSNLLQLEPCNDV